MNKLTSQSTKYKTLSLPVMFESLKDPLISSRIEIAVICVAKLESFQLLFPSKSWYNSLNNEQDKAEKYLTKRMKMSNKCTGNKKYASR